MLLRHLSPSKGLCIGTRLIVTKMQQNIIGTKSINGADTFLIRRIHFIPSQTKIAFKFKYTPFPIQSSFPMTVNKYQRQALENVCLVLNEQVFSHGHLYVGLS